MSSREPRSELWWASPTGAVLLVVPVSIWLAWSTSDLNFRLLYRTPRLITDGLAALFVAGGLMLILGIAVGSAAHSRRRPEQWPGLDGAQLDVVQRAAGVCFWLTVTGYAAFAVGGASRGATPRLVLDALTSQDLFGNELEELFAPVTGITTLTQFGVAYSVLAGVLWVSGRRGVVLRRLAIVMTLALLRTFVLTERLALIEIVIPLVVTIAVHRHRSGDRKAGLAPLVALPALVLMFGIFEYSRSWVFFRTRTTSSYPEFVLDRLAGYYSTAYNNGAAQLIDGGYPGRLPYHVLEALWTAPGVAQLRLYERLSGRSAEVAYGDVLLQRANPEFNNRCGLCSPFVDLGTVGALLYLLAAGLLVGVAWGSFRAGGVAGLLSYPVVFLGLLELPRYLYWSQGRLVPAALALIVTAVVLRRLGKAAGSAAYRRVELPPARETPRLASNSCRVESPRRP